MRIKPDITGNGTNLYSSLESSDSAYGNLTGTSMASPNVMGTLLLLQQHFKNKTQHFMKAATLKALACHTADDAGNVRSGCDFWLGIAQW
ncbi:S8 family serine peptidase [Flavobacterium sp. 3HN19-14]|uniref:S8 family serine peptidase n=1 Tax=Flavobacterium sp. 3HN19-14 TaxID=3448133 RepID=UPI003EE0BACF